MRAPRASGSAAGAVIAVRATSQWRRTAQFVAAVMLAGVGGAATTYLLTLPSPHCRKASEAIAFISHHQDLFTSSTNLKAGADVSTYQHWAAELQRYANATSDPTVAPQLRRIADQAAHAAGLVGLARAIPVDGTTPTQAGIAQGFALNMTDIVNTENQLLDACNLR